MQEGRLFQIIYYLLDKGHATASELARRFEVSVRTIYRDVEVLSAARIPIYTEAGRNGGIYLMDGFVLEKVVFSDQEKHEILTALQSLAAVSSQSEHSVLQKLSALFDLHTESWLEVDFSRWGHAEQDQQKFSIIKNAILHRNSLLINYVGSNGSCINRKIQPLRLLYKSGDWYIKAFCMEKHDFRIFKVNRMTELQALEETFLPLSVPEVKHQPLEQLCKLKLRFSAGVAYRVYDEFAVSQIEQQQNGDLLVQAQMPEGAWLIGYLLSFGTQAEILEPPNLRQQMAKWAKEIYEKNQY